MPLTKAQADVLQVICAARTPHSFVAGSTPLNRDAPRYSVDIDIFHDRQDQVAAIADADAATLTRAGFSVAWQRRLSFIHSALAERGDDRVKVEWVVDADFRFFPAVADPLFGYALHPLDLATNKAQAAANRRELRDIIDLLTIHRDVLALGPTVWAAVGKSPGFTPEGLIAEIRRNLIHPASAWREVVSTETIEPAPTLAALRQALDEAEAFVKLMPSDASERLFLTPTGAVQPAPDRLPEYLWHEGSRGGRWPDDPAIARALGAPATA